MNLKELKKLITAGESENLEFKNSTGQRTAAMKAVCGMLNSLGGFVLFGVTDKGELRGQDINANTMETISAELSRIDPPAFPDIETVTLENGKSVIALRVPGGGGLYTYDGRPHIRTGPTTRHAQGGIRASAHGPGAFHTTMGKRTGSGGKFGSSGPDRVTARAAARVAARVIAE